MLYLGECVPPVEIKQKVNKYQKTYTAVRNKREETNFFFLYFLNEKKIAEARPGAFSNLHNWNFSIIPPYF